MGDPAKRFSAQIDKGNGKFLSQQTFWAVVFAILFVAGGVLVLLWISIDSVGLNGKDLIAAQLDAVKIAASVAVAEGGIFGLYLAVHRQRISERDFKLRDEMAEDVRLDSSHKRITELYAKAVDQLGHASAPVRLGGLYALERLAQDVENLRQTVVNVLCAYLRMPYVPTDESVYQNSRQMLDADKNAIDHERHEKVATGFLSNMQEREVRLAAQRLLREHFRSDSELSKTESLHWGVGVNIDLTGATLINFDLDNCQLGRCTFDRAIFIGEATFNGAQFVEIASFKDADFRGHTLFSDLEFQRGVSFMGAKFDEVNFSNSTLSRKSVFTRAEFRKDAYFDVKSMDEAYFPGAHFYEAVDFTGATFSARAARFRGATFHGIATFGEAAVNLDLSGARVNRSLAHTWPEGWIEKVVQNPKGLQEDTCVIVRRARQVDGASDAK